MSRVQPILEIASSRPVAELTGRLFAVSRTTMVSTHRTLGPRLVAMHYRGEFTAVGDAEFGTGPVQVTLDGTD